MSSVEQSGKRWSLSRVPFWPVVGLSVSLNVCHAIVQSSWRSLRYQNHGSRPLGAEALIAVEVLLQMLLLTRAIQEFSDEGPNRWKYAAGEAVSVSIWIATSFLL